MKRGGAVLGAVLVMVLAFAGTAQAEHAADHQDQKAVQAFAAGRYDEALELYAGLYSNSFNPIYLRNIGRCYQKLKQPDKAIDKFRDYLEKAKKLTPDEKAQINGYIKEMEALRDEQASKQQATPPAVVPVAPVQPIPPPQPEGPPPGYTAQPAGAYPGPQGPPAYPPPGGGQQQPGGALVTQAPPPEQASSGPVYTKWWFWTIIGAVVVGGVVTAVVLSSGTSKPACPANVVSCLGQ